MTTVTKTVKFDAAHVLPNHGGLCRNLHGHTYRVDVTAACADDAGRDMVIDFQDIKKIAAETICERFDHTFIYDAGSAVEREIAAVLERNGMRTAPVGFRTTAENLARYFYETLQPRIPCISAVRVLETADNAAEYRSAGGGRVSAG
ncbi:MAG: 6-carboxytetrahydropterin synthase QueD [Kiritimatiellae bacterium]|nr:6-carboxytetrahydropterin synthase QueD [Kiritimatiellia bacterium]